MLLMLNRTLLILGQVILLPSTSMRRHPLHRPPPATKKATREVTPAVAAGVDIEVAIFGGEAGSMEEAGHKITNMLNMTAEVARTSSNTKTKTSTKISNSNLRAPM